MRSHVFAAVIAFALVASAPAFFHAAQPPQAAAGAQATQGNGGAEPCARSPICNWGRERNIISHETRTPDLRFTYAYPFALPDGGGGVSAVAINSKGHLFAFQRNAPGKPQLFEFDEHHALVRSIGDDVIGHQNKAHGMAIDADDNVWICDENGDTVMKLSPQGKVLLTLGTKGQRGDWNDSTHLLNEPNDVIIGRNGDIFVAQGHTPGAMGDPRVLKFDKTGKFIKSWGGKGKEPGKFDVAHGIAIDAKGQLWVTDRENQRIQIFDQDGKYIREVKYAGLPCSLDIGPQNIYMVNGFAGQLLKLDLDGKVLAATGKTGKGIGEFGEAHMIAVGPRGEIFVADSVNAEVQKFVKR